MKSIDTNYRYIEFREITRPQVQKHLNYYGPGKYLFFRYFTFYQYDPNIVLSNENFKYLGTIDQYGKIRVPYHMRGDSSLI